MTYTTADARQGLLDTVAGAIEQLAVALAALGEAYEQLDEMTAERLQDQLFRPVQVAYGRAQRTAAGFAERHDLPRRSFSAAPQPSPSLGVQTLLARAIDAASDAERTLAELQDSLLPVEVGDPELRDGLRATRESLDRFAVHARELARTFGR